jgi:hypothetical protein
MSKTTTQNVVQTTSNIGAAQLPYYNAAMQGAQSLLTAQTPRYVNAQGQPIGRIAGFTEQQKNLQNQVAGMQTPSQFGDASTLATAAGLGSITAGQYTPGQFGFQQVAAPQAQAAQMQAAQSNYRPDLTTFQMQAPDQFGQQQVNQYMSPYMQSVVDVQKREASRDARQQQLAQDLGAARQGTYGGSRQLLATLGRERMLGQQLGDIQARGLQAGFEQAAQQFERDRTATMEAQRQNLASQISTQQLRTTTDLQVAMANLSNDQQARVQNLAAENQMRGMNAENALRSALANQQADMEMQRMAEQSRQFGSQQGLAGLAQAGQMGQTLSNIGSAQQQAEAQRLGLQQGTAAQEQALNQQKLDLAYSDFMREADNPYTQLQRYMSLMSGVPQATTTTQTSSAPGPGIGQQIMGAGLGALGMYKTLGS